MLFVTVKRLPTRPLLLCVAAGALASCAANRTASDLAGKTMAEIAAYEQELDNKISAEEGFYRTQSATLVRLEGAIPLPDPDTLQKDHLTRKLAAAKKDVEDATRELEKVNAQTSPPADPATKQKAQANLQEAQRKLQKAADLVAKANQSPDALPSEEQVRESLAYLRITHATNSQAIQAVDTLLAQGTPTARSAISKYVQSGITEDIASIQKAVDARQAIQHDLMKNLAELDAGKKRLEEARKALAELREKKSTLQNLKEVLEFGKDVRSRMEVNATKPAL